MRRLHEDRRHRSVQTSNISFFPFQPLHSSEKSRANALGFFRAASLAQRTSEVRPLSAFVHLPPFYRGLRRPLRSRLFPSHLPLTEDFGGPATVGFFPPASLLLMTSEARPLSASVGWQAWVFLLRRWLSFDFIQNRWNTSNGEQPNLIAKWRYRGQMAS